MATSKSRKDPAQVKLDKALREVYGWDKRSAADLARKLKGIEALIEGPALSVVDQGNIPSAPLPRHLSPEQIIVADLNGWVVVNEDGDIVARKAADVKPMPQGSDEYGPVISLRLNKVHEAGLLKAMHAMNNYKKVSVVRRGLVEWMRSNGYLD